MSRTLRTYRYPSHRKGPSWILVRMPRHRLAKQRRCDGSMAARWQRSRYTVAPQGIHAFARSSGKQLERRKQAPFIPVALNKLPTKIGADNGHPANRYRLAILACRYPVLRASTPCDPLSRLFDFPSISGNQSSEVGCRAKLSYPDIRVEAQSTSFTAKPSLLCPTVT